ncbi:MAG: DUF362 domain-containing protein, partial [Candidatus Methylomirabilis sp.]|nr:DUF362 domain-containing protein [Deltaproteobacteria bacterium]
ADIFRERGAKVYLADQPGVTYVHPRPEGGGKGSTLAIFKDNGLFEAAERGGAEPYGFEAAGYQSYFESGSPEAPHWRGPLMVPNLVREVDHIVYLNRVSAHLLAGATLALKNAVGWIREDSRLELHRDADSFLEKCAEIAAAPEIRERIRLVMSEASRVQTTIGPDFGHSVALDPGLLVASDNLAMHDVACYGVLRYARETLTPAYATLVEPYPRHSSWMNRFFVGKEWGLDEAMNYKGYVPPSRGRALDNTVIRRGVEIFSPQGARPALAWLGEAPAEMREAVANA